MATPTLTLINYALISTAEAITSWTTWSTLDPDLYKEGSNAITGTFRTDLATGYFNDATARTCANRHFRAWMNFTAVAFLDTEANNGMEFYMSDGTNTEYKVAFGSDTYQGGWKNFVIDGNLFTTLTAASVNEWGCRFNNTANPANKDNFWVDFFRYLDGYYFTGGASGAGNAVTLADLEAADSATTAAYGIITQYEGVYIGYGEIQIGNGTTTTYFEMDGDLLVFSDQQVATGLYTLRGEGTGCNITIAGSTITSSGTATNTRFLMDMDDADLASFSMTGTVLQRAAASTFKTGQTISSCTFDDCAQIVPGAATFSGNTIKNTSATDAGLLWPSTSNISDCVFEDNTTGAGIEHTTPTASDYDGNTFSGNTYDVLNSGNASTITAGSFVVDEGYKILTVGTTDFTAIGAADNVIGTKFVATGVGTGTGTATQVLVINKTNGSNPTTCNNTGTNADHLFVGSVPITVTVLDDSTGLGINLAHVQLFLTSDYTTEVMSGATNASGVITSSFSGSTPAGVEGWAREMDVSGTDYEPKNISGTIGTSGLSITVRLKPVNY